MWKDRRPDRTDSEAAIDNRDKSIRSLIDELVSGTQELKSIYTRDDKNGKSPRPQEG